MEKITATTAGSLSGINTAEIILKTDSLVKLCTKPIQLIANPGANKVIEFVDAIFIYKFGTACMKGGGNIYISYLGFSALSTSISAATLMGEEADKVIQMQLGNTTDMNLPVNYGLYLQMTEPDFEKMESTSTAKVIVMYRVLTLA